MKHLIFALFFFFSMSFMHAQSLQPPSDFIGEDIETNFYPHHKIVEYVKYVADNSSNVKLIPYGKTNQNRPLLLAVVASKKNMDKLEELRLNNLKRTGLLDGNINNNDKTAIVWLSYGVHGNEASCPNTAVQMLYKLASAKGGKISKWLENTIVIIDPSLNPDGYSRYVNWYRNASGKVVNTDIISREHKEPWPAGRTNHYHFDLNRDWAWASQVETQQRLKIYHQWMPHIHVDFHEQYPNNPYYFAPAAAPFHEYITEWQGDFQTQIGINHAKYFDIEGWAYFTKEFFDLFYPAYGDTYPTFNGAIGMTYEQAGHTFAGRAVQLENDNVLSLKDRIDHHTTTGLSTIETASANAGNLVDQFETYFHESAQNPKGKYQTYIIKEKNTSKIKRLCKLLDLHQIRYGCSHKSQKITAYSYISGKQISIKIDKDDLLLSAQQPMSVLTQTLFDPHSNLLDSLTYDITAWALPYAHGLETYATTQAVSVDQKYLFADYNNDLKDEAPYAYIADWHTLDNAQFLSALLNKKVKVRYSVKEFEMNNQRYNAGTLVILRSDNKAINDWKKAVREAAEQFEQKIDVVSSGFSGSGPDFGSENMRLIKKPKILTLHGEDVSPFTYGNIWHYFDSELAYPLTSITVDELLEVNLSNFTTLILPDGEYKFYKPVIYAKIKHWIKSGGKLIVMGNANELLIKDNDFKIKKKKSEKEDKKPMLLKDKLKKYGSQERDALKNGMPGAIYKLNIDNSHPLAFGLPQYYFSLKASSKIYEINADNWNVGYVGQHPFTIGFIGSKVKKNMEETTVFAVQDMKAGQVVYMIDNPLYRSFWQQGTLLFSNAIFFK